MPQTCLEVAMHTRVVGFAAPTDVSVDDISIPPVQNPPVVVENLTLSQLGVEKLRSGARLWRNMLQPTTLPYDDINYQLQYMDANGEMDMSRAQTDGIAYALPLAIMAGISLLLFVLYPIVMACVACCRCCSCCCCHDCCGGKLDQEEPSTTKCFMYTLLTLALAACLISFGALIVASDTQMKKGVDDVEAAAMHGLDNFDLFKNNTLTQASDLPAVLFPAVLDGVFGLLDKLNAGLAFGVVDVVEEASTLLLTRVRNIADLVDSNYEAMLVVQEREENITQKVADLKALLVAMDSDHDTLVATCAAVRNGELGMERDGEGWRGMEAEARGHLF